MKKSFSDAVPEHRGIQDVVCYLPVNIESKEELFEALANVFSFPGFFGMNWDALSDMLMHLDELFPDKERVVLVHQDVPLKSNQGQKELYLDILSRAIEKSETGGPKFEVVFL
jgi:RNAse (barnase) inhibitor barstar